ncbi:hypothetical protein RDI58_019770 [Solanum bulbocastanum]|uniref:Uncharacterized protein n=1 Tax=Solanum bulbocastanum TaxID=147425 RepID=A0AAN8Y799_SOLBU
MRVLVINVLQSMSIYVLSSMNPPKKVIDQIHQIFAKKNWGKVGGISGKHWVVCGDLCFPETKGGIGFTSLHDINKALFAKLWWNFRSMEVKNCYDDNLKRMRYPNWEHKTTNKLEEILRAIP